MFHPRTAHIRARLCSSSSYKLVWLLAAFSIASPAFGQQLVVNPASNKVYLAEESLIVFDGPTGITTHIPTSAAYALAVNPVTNRIYASGDGVNVIDGATNVSTPIIASGNPEGAIALNPATNKIYVASNEPQLLVIDGNTNIVQTVPLGIQPGAIAVNPVTNKIYVSNALGPGGVVLDGLTNNTKPIRASGYIVAVNPVTNKIYFNGLQGASTGVTVLDGATNSTTFAPTDVSVDALALNPVTNKIYVGSSSGTVVVIDGVRSTPLICLLYPRDSLPH